MHSTLYRSGRKNKALDNKTYNYQSLLFLMVSKNSKPAQGTIEYLVIIAVVVVVALVVVGLLISLSAPGAQVSQVAGKLNAEVQTISVLQAIAGSDGNGVLVIKNSSGDGITITKITIGDSNQDVSAYFAQGDLRSIQLNKLPLCKPGVTKIYSIKSELPHPKGCGFRIVGLECV